MGFLLAESGKIFCLARAKASRNALTAARDTDVHNSLLEAVSDLRHCFSSLRAEKLEGIAR
jgi:hypothetical protein